MENILSLALDAQCQPPKKGLGAEFLSLLINMVKAMAIEKTSDVIPQSYIHGSWTLVVTQKGGGGGVFLGFHLKIGPPLHMQ